MSGNVNSSTALVKRAGPSTRLIEGPKPGQRSLYRQQVLDEDEYTEALSHIIGRDFFPNLPHIHATNAYLTALTNNDPELLSSSIRRLAELAKAKEGQGSVDSADNHGPRSIADQLHREFDQGATPRVAAPGRRHVARTPIGARGWDTPVIPSRGSREDTFHDPDDSADDSADDSSSSERDEEIDTLSERPKKRKRPARPRQPPPTRTDLSLDAFQRNYTSEDNASFVQIVDQENRQRREERWDWAWKAEQQAETRRIEGETKRQLILDAATSGSWRVDGDGKRMIGGLAQGGRDSEEEAWRDPKRITEGDVPGIPRAIEAASSSSDDTKALIPVSRTDGTIAIASTATLATTTSGVIEHDLPSDHPLSKALVSAGLPPTALTSSQDGAVVPARETASGSGEGRGRGAEDRSLEVAAREGVTGEEKAEHIPLAGSGADQWGYKTRNNLFFPADANVAPYPVTRNIVKTAQSRQAPPSIAHANTRIQDEEEVRPAAAGPSRSQRSSSPARSWVDAAVKGTPYRPGNTESELPSINHYPLVANDPTPTPQNLPSLLTWGTLMSTPRAIDGSQDPLDLSGPSFRLPESKRRDELGRRLADKASRAMKERAKGFTPRSSGSALSAALRSAAEHSQRSVRKTNATPGRMLPPSATPRRQADTLTPAARNLLQRSLGRSPLTKSGVTGLKASAGVRNRGAAMEKASGWGNPTSKPAGKGVASSSWTPSPPRRS